MASQCHKLLTHKRFLSSCRSFKRAALRLQYLVKDLSFNSLIVPNILPSRQFLDIHWHSENCTLPAMPRSHGSTSEGLLTLLFTWVKCQSWNLIAFSLCLPSPKFVILHVKIYLHNLNWEKLKKDFKIDLIHKVRALQQFNPHGPY